MLVPVPQPVSLSALTMAKLIPREGEAIKRDPASASRKRARQPRVQSARGFAVGARAQRATETRLSVAGVPRRSLLQNT